MSHTSRMSSHAMSRLVVCSVLTMLLPSLLLLCCPSSTASAASPYSFRIMSYNIQSGSGFDHVYNLTRQADTINRISESSSPSVHGELELVSLQEVDNMTQRHPGDDQIALLASATKMPHFQFAKFRPFQGGAYGIGIMSRLPIVEHRMLQYEKPSSAGGLRSYRRSRDDERCAKYAPDDFCQGALAVRVQLQAEEPLFIWYVTTHLGLQGVQAEEARQLAHRLVVPLQETNIPIIVSGDFNAEPSSEAVQILLHEANMIDTWEMCGSGKASDGFTFNSQKPYERIDYQLLWLPREFNNKMTCVRASVPVTEASDHRPYLVEYVINK